MQCELLDRIHCAHLAVKMGNSDGVSYYIYVELQIIALLENGRIMHKI